jgi:hypothetical protein
VFFSRRGDALHRPYGKKNTLNHSMKRLLSRENLLALALCLILILVIIVTASSAPLWIYQGF